MAWLWAADAFPYPLWLTYKILLQTTDARQSEFAEKLWDVMIATMRGEVSDKVTTKQPFNLCKLVVREKSEPLAAGVYDGEALTRMMVGFYSGLWFASRGSAVGAAILLPLWSYHLITLVTGIPWLLPHTAHLFGMTLLLLLVSFVFNTIMLYQVVRNFRILRMSEAQTVFDSYCIVFSDNEEA